MSDAFNRHDQQCRSYCDFTVLELIDMTDRRHPTPLDPISKAFESLEGAKVNPKQVQIAGNIVNLDEIKKDVAFLTSQDKDHSMNMLDNRLTHFQNLWREGTLKDTFTDNSYIDVGDKNAFDLFCARHVKATEAPVLIAEMVQFEKKLNSKGIQSIFLFPGYGELARFQKSRYGLMQEIPSSLTNSRD